ncbi:MULTISPECIES: hypothetical protein [unclassified Bradyrhizobium]
MEEKDKPQGHNKPRFRIGGPDELLVLLWARGDDQGYRREIQIELGRG